MKDNSERRNNHRHYKETKTKTIRDTCRMNDDRLTKHTVFEKIDGEP